MKIPESLRPILGRLKDVRYSHGDCWRARCVCGADELRIFELGLEIRCPSCGVNTFGVDQFLERFMGEETAQAEVPEPKASEPKCKVCGEPLKILPYTRRRKEYCSGKCQKRAERERKKMRQ